MTGVKGVVLPELWVFAEKSLLTHSTDKSEKRRVRQFWNLTLKIFLLESCCFAVSVCSGPHRLETVHWANGPEDSRARNYIWDMVQQRVQSDVQKIVALAVR